MAPNERQPVVLVTDDSFGALIRMFMRSPKFTAYSQGTQDIWGRELNFMLRPDCVLCTLKTTEIRPALVQAYFDGLADRPGKQDSALSVLKQLEKWAIVRDLLPRQITLGVEIGEGDGGGHIPWTDEQVALGEAKARPDLAKAITLISNTGQRGSDAIRMCWTDLETYKGIEGIRVIQQQKTGEPVWIPITSELATAMKAWPRRPGPFLTQENGSPWTRQALSHAWAYQRDTDPALKPLGRMAVEGQNTTDRGLVLHGLRATACVRLRLAGCSIPQIADMTGMSEENVATYCRLSDQRENAVAAVISLERTILERNSRKTTSGGK